MSDVVLVINSERRRDPEWLDQLADELQQDLRQIRGLAVRKATTSAAPGAKSGALEQIGQLVASGGAIGTTAWAIRDIVIKFLDRTRATSVTVKRGDKEVTIVRPTDGQVDEIVDRIRDVLDDE
ncbi:hypothetical protein [Nocardia sp. NPDC051463]|uniref:effector-associated constant component EACC1 n=1 Tax=Nocardia sp. NPDC051463 TaxID=3154845 RepID=UPI00342D9ADA